MKASKSLVLAGIMLSAVAAYGTTQTDPLNQGIRADLWNVVNNSALGAPWTIQTTSSGLRISKTADTDSTTFLSGRVAGVSSVFAMDGDLSVSVGYHLSNFPLSNTAGWNQLILTLEGTNGPTYCESLRFSNQNNQLVEGYSSLGGMTVRADTSTSGTLTVSRSGQTMSAWINDGGGAISLGSVTDSSLLGPLRVCMLLREQPGSDTLSRPTTALDATFSNFTATADTISSPVPEPVTILGILMGLTGLGRYVRRRRTE